MLIYLDESGDLGFDFTLQRTSRYLILACLICNTSQSIQAIKKAITLTVKNKLANKITEVKGSNTAFSVKKYFLKQLEKNFDWIIISIAADKQTWLRHHKKLPTAVDKNLFYDEAAKRLLSQIKIAKDSSYIQIVVDKSKSKSALKKFDQSIQAKLRSSLSAKTSLTIYHRQSFADPGLQATDMFSWGIYRKYQNNDTEWYDVFKHRIALEMEFKF